MAASAPVRSSRELSRRQASLGEEFSRVEISRVKISRMRFQSRDRWDFVLRDVVGFQTRRPVLPSALPGCESLRLTQPASQKLLAVDGN